MNKKVLGKIWLIETLTGSGYTVSEAAGIVDTLSESIKVALLEGNKVKIPDTCIITPKVKSEKVMKVAGEKRLIPESILLSTIVTSSFKNKFIQDYSSESKRVAGFKDIIDKLNNEG